MKTQFVKSSLWLASLAVIHLVERASAAVISVEIAREDGIVSQTGGPEELRRIDVNSDGIEDFQFRATGREFMELFPSGTNRVAAPPPPPDLGASLDSMPPLSLIGAGPGFGVAWWRNTLPEFELGAHVPHEWSLFITVDNPVTDLELHHYTGVSGRGRTPLRLHAALPRPSCYLVCRAGLGDSAGSSDSDSSARASCDSVCPPGGITHQAPSQVPVALTPLTLTSSGHPGGSGSAQTKQQPPISAP